MKANASCSGSGWSDGAAARRTFQFSESGTWPAVATKSKYASTVPANASAMPTEQMRMYFHDASTDALVRRNGMTMADVIVVASMATHMSATFWTVTAVSMVAANKLMNTRNVRADGSSRWSARPGPSDDARSMTKAIHTARSADSASNRAATACARDGGAPVAVASAAARLTASDSPAAITLTQPTHVRYGRTAIATLAATSGGPIRNSIIIWLGLHFEFWF